jgi:hypothetical protein
MQGAGRGGFFSEARKTVGDIDADLRVAGVSGAVFIRIGLSWVGRVAAIVVFVEHAVSVVIIRLDSKIVVAGVSDSVLVAVELVRIWMSWAIVRRIRNVVRILIIRIGRR